MSGRRPEKVPPRLLVTKWRCDVEMSGRGASWVLPEVFILTAQTQRSQCQYTLREI